MIDKDADRRSEFMSHLCHHFFLLTEWIILGAEVKLPPKMRSKWSVSTKSEKQTIKIHQKWEANNQINQK